MTKQDIIDHITYECGLRRDSAIRAVNGVIDTITKSLAKGEAVSLRGFATLRVVDVAERKACDIQRNEEVIVPTHKAVRLVASKELKDRLNNGTVD